MGDNRDLLVTHTRLSDAAEEWDRAGRHDEGALYRGARLAYWLEPDGKGLNAIEVAFLEASNQLQERENERYKGLYEGSLARRAWRRRPNSR